MNVWARVAIGAALGALTTLLLHPVSRPRLFGALGNWGMSAEARKSPELVVNLDRLPEPKSVADASVWMEAGARRIIARRPTLSKEWESFVQTARAGALQEPDNALWPQMEAVFRLAQGRKSEAWALWREASRRARWDDGQTHRLESFAVRLGQAHHEGGWVWIPAYGRRSTSVARAIEWFARDLVRSTGLTAAPDLELRYATVMNGRLMREGARSIKVGEVALAVVELGSYPSNLMSISSPKKLLIARADLFHALRAQGWTLRADETDRAFRDNDGWFGFPNSEEAESNAQGAGMLVLLSNLWGTITASVAVLGGLLVILGRIVGRGGTPQPSPAPVVISSVVACALAWFATHAVLPSMLLLASILGLLLTPANIRTRASVHLGYLHSLALFITGLGLSLAVAVAVIANTTAGVESLPYLGWASELLVDQRAAVALAVVVLCVVIGMSPAFALVHRFSTLQIVARSSEQMGRAMILGALIALIVGAPPALYTDRILGTRLAELVNNEPVHYYVNE